MIVAVCLNAALDVTYHVDALRPGDTHRVRAVHAHAGGKATNVVRVLRELGEPVRLVGLAGGPTGAAIETDLADNGLAFALMTIAGESRRTVTVVADGAATLFSEPGPAVTDDEWQRFASDFAGAAEAAAVVVLSGSLPPGVPVTAYAELAASARAGGAQVIVDADGPALHAALTAGPALVTPNAAEAGVALHRPVVTEAQAVSAARELVTLGAGSAVVTRGADGLVAVADGRAYAVRPGETISGNPTGAGDALTAGLAAGLAADVPWPELLADACALAVGAVAAGHAGAVDAEVAARVRPSMIVEEL